MTHGEISPSTGGATRRDFLKRSAIVGGAVWAIPAVQMVSMTAAHADSPSAPGTPGTPDNPGTTGNPQNPPPSNPQNPPPTGETSQVPPSTSTPAVEPAVLPATAPATTAVEGTVIQGGTLPKTGPDFPIATTLAMGAGLIVAGGAAVAASHNKTATDGAGESGRHARGPAE